MSLQELSARLDYHAGNRDEERAIPSFVGMLRPYRGLHEAAFVDVMDCIRALAPELGAGALPRSLVTNLWAVCWYPRYWGLSEGSMLRRNALISESDQQRLSEWLDRISNAVSRLLEGTSVDEAFERP